MEAANGYAETPSSHLEITIDHSHAANCYQKDPSSHREAPNVHPKP